jgi:hypothetical protein
MLLIASRRRRAGFELHGLALDNPPRQCSPTSGATDTPFQTSPSAGKSLFVFNPLGIKEQ